MVRTVVSLKSMTKLLKKRNQGFLVELRVTRSENEDAIITKKIEKLLSDYPEVGEQTLGLPPHRSRDHAITLQLGAQPPNIRPYRYPHSQKLEIKHLVKEMLAAGIIKASSSPYSSPVLLIKKKDGSWRICVDY
ncbi:hypothetical protein T459_15383 [Capsicum annuum]|uniref:Uncharacterized protein n=1 Tax=Capsicum annuum TaxID=4072 RepID=A0A2G2ZK48_CAPAN|nr:hypothetical protein T459_15383 [Capsicum annuum]